MNEVRSQPLFVLEAELHKPQMVAKTPFGERKIVTVAGGTFKGERLQGTILPGGADWALKRNDGALQLDVRLTLQTDDGAAIYMTYRGIRHGPEAVLARLSKGEPVDPSEYYFRIAPFFETGVAKYAWLNNIVCVGYGERMTQGPRYTIYEIL